jgi:hypothetical protein
MKRLKMIGMNMYYIVSDIYANLGRIDDKQTSWGNQISAERLFSHSITQGMRLNFHCFLFILSNFQSINPRHQIQHPHPPNLRPTFCLLPRHPSSSLAPSMHPRANSGYYSHRLLSPNCPHSST